jgi:hypothetical protein
MSRLYPSASVTNFRAALANLRQDPYFKPRVLLPPLRGVLCVKALVVDDNGAAAAAGSGISVSVGGFHGRSVNFWNASSTLLSGLVSYSGAALVRTDRGGIVPFSKAGNHAVL